MKATSHCVLKNDCELNFAVVGQKTKEKKAKGLKFLIQVH